MSDLWMDNYGWVHEEKEIPEPRIRRTQQEIIDDGLFELFWLLDDIRIDLKKMDKK